MKDYADERLTLVLVFSRQVMQKVAFAPGLVPEPVVENEDGDPANTSSFGDTIRTIQSTAFGCLQNIVIALGSVPDASPTCTFHTNLIMNLRLFI
jgi:hypothetical protein